MIDEFLRDATRKQAVIECLSHGPASITDLCRETGYTRRAIAQVIRWLREATDAPCLRNLLDDRTNPRNAADEREVVVTAMGNRCPLEEAWSIFRTVPRR